MVRLAQLLAPALAVATLSGGCQAPTGPDGAEPTARARAVTPTPRPVPEGSFEGDPFSLLDQYAERDPAARDEAETWTLPFKAKRIMISLLTAAAHDRLEDLRFILAPDATWGLPDRRELEARPVFAGDDGAAFFDALRGAASRFRGVLQGQGGRGANSNCPPMTPGAQEAVRTGAEPYWCYYVSDDGLDLLVFRMQVISGRGRVTYVGLFEQRPEAPIHVGRKDPAPPLVPPLLRDPNAPAAPTPSPVRRPPSQPRPG